MLNIFRRLFPRKRKKDPLAWLKKKGRRIIARVEDCEILAYVNWEDQASVVPTRIEIGKDNLHDMQSEGCYIQYNYTSPDGRQQKLFSPFIQKDKTTLSVMLMQLREISIYLDPQNPSAYYFDLEDLTFSA